MNLTILDFTTKLPGPLATSYLANFGFNIIKIEHPDYPDRFNNSDLFPLWYQNINKNKKILHTTQIKDLFNSSIGVLYEPKDPIEKFFPDSIPFVALKLSAKTPQHDLNFLAQEGFLNQHIQNRTENIIAPPLLPIAGISFAHQLSMHFLFEYSKKKNIQKTLYFEDLLKDALFSLKQPQINSALHSGLCPCYNIYRLKDGSYIALAAVEERFWNNLIKSLLINLSSEDRFDSNKKETLSNYFLKLNKEDLLNKLNPKDCALNFIEI